MSENTYRIRTDVSTRGTKYLKTKFEQDFDFIEILSLKISQQEAYQRFCSDYGVVAGRVIMNSGVGVPNAKISIFIPIDEIDIEDEEIRGLYPFTTPFDKDSEGIRYNLLPKDSQSACHTPVGTFPSKREILDNDKLLDIHCKYYKFTAVTNESGDFLLFGVPLGTWTLHVDVDLSDIGIYSQKPYDLIREGIPENTFASPTKFKANTNLDSLAQLKNVRRGVTVRPFWGDPDNCEIGITRVDIDLNYNIQPSAIFMGSIFGDNEKNSINKRCRPRKKLGDLCETIATEGSIEMIRKDLSGNIERFDVEGGRVIDENGAWAYQIPMNLDYMVTDEFGNLVPSGDPNKGIPTRARVRFRIGMDVTGGEGRLRTRAKYLVPHNPNSDNEQDYRFDENTSDQHFKDMYWNKIYSVKNFIPRFQTAGCVQNRNFIGIKNVDGCTGFHNPFPFNRMDSNINPLFSIICILFTIVVTIVVLINSILINTINGIFMILNGFLFAICKLIWGLRFLTINKEKKCKFCIGDKILDDDGYCEDCGCNQVIPYVPCIVLSCNEERYAPGCGGNTLGFNAANENNPIDYWPNSTPDNGVDAGITNCVSLSLAESLNLFEFDFYNDWINGTLYSFLLKYKRKRKGKSKEKFCEYDCDEFGGGVDGNNDGNSDNKCKRNWLVETCTGSVADQCGEGDGVRSGVKSLIKDGLIKKFEDEFYYAAYTHSSGHKLFATDIINLGAIEDCDWQGVPKIQPDLVPTSYLIPPLTNEYDDVDGSLVVSGFDSPGNNNSESFIFNVSCLGIFTNERSCNNIRRLCEIGTGLDEDRTDEAPDPLIPCSGGGQGIADRFMDNCDIDDLFIRDVFIELNDPSAGIDLASSNFNQHAYFGANAYDTFRNYSNQFVSQPRGGSLYFYFGLIPGRSALDLMNRRYFTSCIQEKQNDFLILGTATTVSAFGASDGSINITIIGGVGPFTYQWSNGATTEDLTNVPAGNYTVTVIDSEGNTGTQTFNVGQPAPIICNVTVSPVSVNGATDGGILVSSIGGGTGPYDINITGPVNLSVNNIVGPSYSFGPAGSNQVVAIPAGTYTVSVTDSSLTPLECLTTGVTITTPPPLVFNVNVTNATCNGFSNGIGQIIITSGVPPYMSITSGPSNYSSTLLTQSSLSAGIYTVTVTDAIGQTGTQTFTVTEPTSIQAVIGATNVSCYGNTDGVASVSSVTGGAGGYTYAWDGPGVDPLPPSPTITGIGSGGLRPAGTYTCTITDANGCERDFSIVVEEPPALTISFVGKTDVVCNGDANGTITVTASGGNPAIGNGGYIFKLNGSIIGSSLNGSFTYNNIPAGSYILTVTDNEGCNSNLINVTITEPSIITITQSTTTSTSIAMFATGGNGGPYQYRKNGGAWQTSSTFTALAANTAYNFEARDINGCISSVFTFSTNP